jgi:hypothetical protein
VIFSSNYVGAVIEKVGYRMEFETTIAGEFRIAVGANF